MEMRYDPYVFLLLIVGLYKKEFPVILVNINNRSVLLFVTHHFDAVLQVVDVPWTTYIKSSKRFCFIMLLIKWK